MFGEYGATQGAPSIERGMWGTGCLLLGRITRSSQGNMELNKVYIIDRFHVRQACSTCLFSGRVVLFVLSIYFGDMDHFHLRHNVVVLLK
jgi:hypothetical protein